MPKHNTTWELCTPKDKESNKTSTRNLDSKTAKTGREKVSDSKCNLVKIENLYRNYFTQVLQKRSCISIDRSRTFSRFFCAAVKPGRILIASLK